MSPVIVPIVFIVIVLTALIAVLLSMKRRHEDRRAVAGVTPPDKVVRLPNTRIGRGATRRLDL